MTTGPVRWFEERPEFVERRREPARRFAVMNRLDGTMLAGAGGACPGWRKRDDEAGCRWWQDVHDAQREASRLRRRWTTLDGEPSLDAVVVEILPDGQVRELEKTNNSNGESR